MSTWHRWLVCPAGPHELERREGSFFCSSCSRDYPIDHGIVRFLEADRKQQMLDTVDGASMVRSYREPSKLLKSVRRIVTSEYFPGKGWRRARGETLSGEGPLLVIGSGVSRYERAIHLDIDDFPGVDVVADAHHLPFTDGSMGAVLCETVLEHVADPGRIIAENFRVLKKGGRFFFIVPFLFPFHGQPGDFQRWTREGLMASFGAAAQLEVGIHSGPCSAMVNVISEWLYVATGLKFPRGYVPIKGVATALLFPFKYLDLVINRFPEAHRLAATLYVSGIR